MSRDDTWKLLFARALTILDSAISAGMPADWSFGGGTVLMLRHRHRFSKDVDIFLAEPQYLGFVTPRLNDTAENGMTDYIEQHNSIKIYFPEGEVDFVAAGALTENPCSVELVLDRHVNVEQSVEIVGKKIHFRAADFKARDMFDLTLVLEREPQTHTALENLLSQKRTILGDRFLHHDIELREDFAALDTLDYAPSYEHCLAVISKHLGID
ncbi:MAG: hypothetical protein D4S02_18170 [Rhodocyclaceae bacterium]|nr:MAG: hypothetical protein D4S02_18170 [Rhodocyclaceae bacterium]